MPVQSLNCNSMLRVIWLFPFWWPSPSFYFKTDLQSASWIKVNYPGHLCLVWRFQCQVMIHNFLLSQFYYSFIPNFLQHPGASQGFGHTVLPTFHSLWAGFTSLPGWEPMVPLVILTLLLHLPPYSVIIPNLRSMPPTSLETWFLQPRSSSSLLHIISSQHKYILKYLPKFHVTSFYSLSSGSH
jgi:hypothetical protein